MNKYYMTVWNIAKNAFVAVAEKTKAGGRSIGPSSSANTNVSIVLFKPLLNALALSISVIGIANGQSTSTNQLPTGGKVVAGQANIQQVGSSTLNISQSTLSAVIDWQTFNLGSGGNVNFLQTSSSSSILNRVLDTNPSFIYGRISAPGQIFFTNASGIYFGKGASIDVGSLTATTHNISNADFIAGKYSFSRDGSVGVVVNEGELKASLGGYIALLAPEVRNQGIVVANLGTVIMASGEIFDLQFHDSQLAGIRVTPSTINALVENGQAVQAPGGLIILSAQAASHLQGSVINSGGTLAANAMVERNGRIVLDSSGSIQVKGSVQVNSATGKGGTAVLIGETIDLQGGAEIQAKGLTGGGTVLVGGDWQGTNVFRSATRVTLQADATIDASAIQNGDGGKVVLWSDVSKGVSLTEVHGNILARGGSQAGNGGQVETSGSRVDISGASVNAGSENGQGGSWLLDPYDYTIDAAAANTIMGSLNAGTNFTVDTASSSSGGINGSSSTGNITVGSAITKTTGAAATLNLTTGSGGVTVNADITSVSNPLTVNITALNSISGSGNFNTNGGTLNLLAGTAGTLSGVISGTGSLTKSSSGRLTLTGANTYTGTTTINGGSLVIGGSGSLGSGTYAGNIVDNGLFYYSSNVNQTLSGVVSGSGWFVKDTSASSTLSLSGVNTYTGQTTISSGKLAIAPGGSIATTQQLNIADAGTLDISGAGAGVSVKSLAYGGGVSLGSNTLTLTAAGSGTPAYSGAISGTGGVTLSGGTQTLTGANTYTGTTTINGGTLALSGTGSIAASSGVSSSGSGVLDISGTSAGATIKALNGSSSAASGVSLGSQTLGLSAAGTSSYAGVIGGTGGVTLSGGTQTLTGANTYTGTTTINGGTLVLSGTGSIAASSNLLINGLGSLIKNNSTNSTDILFSVLVGNQYSTADVLRAKFTMLLNADGIVDEDN